MMPDHLDTSAFWNEVANEVYILVRSSPDFPAIPKNGDIDVLTLDPDAFALKVMTHWPNAGLEVTVRSIAADHIQIDVLHSDGQRRTMYDIYGSKGLCSKSPISPAFATWSLARREPRRIDDYSDYADCNTVWVPRRVDEAVFRYSEYVASFWTGREKDWHIEWITERLTREERDEFLGLVHYFARNPRTDTSGLGTSSHAANALRWPNFPRSMRGAVALAVSVLPEGPVKRLKSTKFGRWIEAKL